MSDPDTPAPPETGTVPPGQPRRRSRWPLLLLVLVVGTGAGVGVWAARYVPIASGGNGAAGVGGVCRSPASSVSDESIDVAGVPFRAGDEPVIFVDLVNRGSRAVSIEAVTLRLSGVMSPKALYVLPQHTGATCEWTGGAPFRPLRLEAGARVPMLWRGVFRDCSGRQGGEGSFSEVTHAFVHWRYGPFRHTSQLPLNVGLRIDFGEGQCPGTSGVG